MHPMLMNNWVDSGGATSNKNSRWVNEDYTRGGASGCARSLGGLTIVMRECGPGTRI